jgi:GNAT superfamily N-acetyltransferase
VQVGRSVAPEIVGELERVERDAWADIYAAAPDDIRSALRISHRLIGDGVLLLCRALDRIQFDRLGGLGVTEPARAETLDQTIAAFDAAGVKNWIIHVAQGASELEHLCAVRGLMPHPRTWAKFIRGVEPASAPTDFIVRESGRADAEAFGATAAAGFGLPPIVGRWLAALPGRPKWTCFLARDGDAAVASGALYIDGNTAWLGIGATLPAHRGRGAQSAMLATRINAAVVDGCTMLTTETGVPHAGEAGPSYGNIQRAGFCIAYLRPNLRRAP